MAVLYLKIWTKFVRILRMMILWISAIHQAGHNPNISVVTCLIMILTEIGTDHKAIISFPMIVNTSC